MRAIIQRVSNARVEVNKKTTGEIKRGLMVLLGIEKNDTEEDLIWLANKIVPLRIFSDENGLMNLSVHQVEGEILVVSQFTLHASYKKGTRPSFIKAAAPDMANELYTKFCTLLSELVGKQTQMGIFGADMQVSLCNDGPVTIQIDTKNKE